MSRKYGSLTSVFLTSLGRGTKLFEWPPPYSDGWRREQIKMHLKGLNRKTYYDTINRLKRKRLVKIVKEAGRQFLALTNAGELQRLFMKARLPNKLPWDGKWRIIIFDIPEDARDKRDQLRWLLKNNGFRKLQASVFISPSPLNREAVSYLHQSRLTPYIRIIRADGIDDDSDLKKKFNL